MKSWRQYVSLSQAASLLLGKIYFTIQAVSTLSDWRYNVLSQNIFMIALFAFSALMIGVALYTKRSADYSTFFAAGRRVNTLKTAFTTTIAWLWADCLFSSSQIGYENGVYALLWFAMATTIGFILFARLASKVRQEAPHAITLPEYIDIKTGGG